MYAYDVDGDKDNDVITSIAAHAFGLSWYENKGKEGDDAIRFEPHVILSDKAGEKPLGVQFSQHPRDRSVRHERRRPEGLRDRQPPLGPRPPP